MESNNHPTAMLYSFESHDTEVAPRSSVFVLPASEPTDERLMLSVKDGGERALEKLYQRHLPLLRTIISRVVNNDADVDDTVQEVFCEIWRQASRYDESKGKALGWIVTLARRRAIDRLRKKQAYGRAEERLMVESTGQTANADHAMDETMGIADRAEILRTIIATLPTAQQEALQLAFFRGMSQREIAKHTGIPLGTIKTRLELAVLKVKSGILAMGGASEWATDQRAPFKMAA